MAEQTYREGDRFGHWTMLRRLKPVGTTRYWLCVCDCGREVEVVAANVTRGRSTRCKSCGARDARRS